MRRDPRECFVYGLWEPGSSGEIRYVGKTLTGHKRFCHYRADRSRTHRGKWLRSLQKRGKTFAVVILEHAAPERLADRERYWIRWCRERGFKLTNGTDGGEGTPGRVASAETRAKMSASQKGKKRSPECCARMSLLQREAQRDPALRAEKAERARGNSYHLGHKHSVSTRARISAICTAMRQAHPEITLRGEHANGAKLTENDVRAIRAAASAGEKQCVLAKRYGIGDPQISWIVQRKSWKHVV